MPHHRFSLILVLTCAAIFSSCGHYTTFTDIYYISNATDEMVTLELQNAVVWDNNSVDTIQQVWYDSSSVSIASGKMIRLHPIKRDFKLNSHEDKLNVTHIIGNSSALIIGSDTILWETQKWRMFTSDTIWSIYNTENWLTTKDKDAPYTFHHSFVISSDRIERSTP